MKVKLTRDTIISVDLVASNVLASPIINLYKRDDIHYSMVDAIMNHMSLYGRFNDDLDLVGEQDLIRYVGYILSDDEEPIDVCPESICLYYRVAVEAYLEYTINRINRSHDVSWLLKPINPTHGYYVVDT